MTWNPWRSLRERPHLLLLIRNLPASVGGGMYLPDEHGAAIVLDRALTQQQRRDVLAHELVHDERGGGAHHPAMPDTWASRVAIDEAQVDREAASRLVPVEALAGFCDRMADLGEGVGPDEVMDEFDVTRRIAEAALDNLTRHERGF
ncbi:MAG: hypothetical protein KY469_10525 [Actinobacteria bacterium]|nr:hypothetical protein [Actinomycetota bacterium]